MSRGSLVLEGSKRQQLLLTYHFNFLTRRRRHTFLRHRPHGRLCFGPVGLGQNDSMLIFVEVKLSPAVP
jgi:hypothetical protein